MSEQPKRFLIVVDEDRKQFTVEGPLTDDAAWKRAIEKARDESRNIKSCDIGSTSRADAIAEWQRHYGLFYRLVDSGNIVSPHPQSREMRAKEDGGDEGCAADVHHHPAN